MGSQEKWRTLRVVIAIALEETEFAKLRSALTSDGVTIVRALDSSQALIEAFSHPTALALVDEKLPGSGGLEVCRQLAHPQGPRCGANVPVIMRLACDDAAQYLAAMELGAMHCLAAAADLQEIYLHIHNHLRTGCYSPATSTLPCTRSGLASGQCLLDALPWPVAVIDSTHTVVEANAVLTRWTGMDINELRRQPLTSMLSRMKLTGDLASLEGSLMATRLWQGEVEGLGRDEGQPQTYRLHAQTIQGNVQNGPDHHVVCLTDVTQYRRDEQRLRSLAETDALTGVANRNLFISRLVQAIERAKNGEESVAILFIDLDQFKAVNDQFGHAEGDRVLREVGGILQSCMRNGDLVARLGGDEFAVLLVGATHQAQEDTAKRILERLIFIFSHEDGLTVEVSCSIGIAVYPRDGSDAANLIKRADKAMYAIKRGGKKGYCFSSVEPVIR